jgi:5-methylcytosine-specific restriction endonuclease McrA
MRVSLKTEFIWPLHRLVECKLVQQYWAMHVLDMEGVLIGSIYPSGLALFPEEGASLYVRWGYAIGIITPLPRQALNLAIEVAHFKSGGTVGDLPDLVEAPQRYRFTPLTLQEQELLGAMRRAERGAEPSAIRRELRMMLAPGKHTKQEWRQIMQRDGWKCLRCGSMKRLTKDHVVPIAKGGSNDAGNLQVLCASCNSWKGAKHIDFRHATPTANAAVC